MKLFTEREHGANRKLCNLVTVITPQHGPRSHDARGAQERRDPERLFGELRYLDELDTEGGYPNKPSTGPHEHQVTTCMLGAESLLTILI